MGGICSTYNGSATATGNVGILTTVNPENGTNMDYSDGISARINGLSRTGTGVKGTIAVNWSGGTVSQATGTHGTVDVSAGTATEVWGARGNVTGSTGTIGTAYGMSGQVSGTLSTSGFTNAYGMLAESKHYGTVFNSCGGVGISTWVNGSNVTTSCGLRAGSSWFNDNTGPQTSSVQNSFGLSASATGGSVGNFSVFGANAGTGLNDWSAFFPGRTFSPGGIWTSSDPELKTNIQEIDGPLDLVMQLHPKRYEFLTEQYPHLGLPAGEQFGFLAPELGEVFPQLVTDAVQPAEVDSAGNEVFPATAFTAVNLNPLLPLAIAAIQQQQASIQSLQETLTQMQEQLAACCTNSADQRVLQAGSGAATAMETDLRIIPNPVADRTELRYTLANEGRVRLEITDATGRTMLVQDEGARASGSHVYEWSTTLLAAGTYHCALYVNDEQLVKKAVKLNNR